MATFVSDGLNLHYEEAGSGPTVLCLHGASCTGAHEWGVVSQALVNSYRVVMPDLRGHGNSDHRAGALAIDLIEGDLDGLIATAKLGTPHLMGFSFGSEVALRFALHRPDAVRSLVLVSPGLGTMKTPAETRAEVPSREKLERVWPRGLRRLHEARHGPDHWVDIMQELWVRHAERPLIPLEALRSLDFPILLICGANDDPRRTRQAHAFAAVHPQAELIEIPGAGHAPHQERPEQVQDVVVAFLARVGADESA
jgi:pimeloyl-ACP methyl ester carboxylesterase